MVFIYDHFSLVQVRNSTLLNKRKRPQRLGPVCSHRNYTEADELFQLQGGSKIRFQFQGLRKSRTVKLFTPIQAKIEPALGNAESETHS